MNSRTFFKLAIFQVYELIFFTPHPAIRFSFAYNAAQCKTEKSGNQLHDLYIYTINRGIFH